MKLAAIDIGSNTIRLLVASVDGGRIRPIRHEREATRLASGLHEKGLIDRSRLSATIKALSRFDSIVRAEGARRLIVAATSVFRESLNSQASVSAIEKATGLSVDVLSGEDEAEIMARGVLSGFDGIGKGILFDIGGGSTEFIATNGDNILYTRSYPVGVVRMLEEAVHDDPPSESDIRRIDDYASRAVNNASEMFLEYAGPESVLIGTAGTATTLASLDLGLETYDWQRVHGHVLSLLRLRDLEAVIGSVSLDNRKKIKGMEQERADLIIAGTRLTIRIMEALGFEQMTVSDFGLLEGLVIKLFMEAER